MMVVSNRNSDDRIVLLQWLGKLKKEEGEESKVVAEEKRKR